ncbi:MAG: CAP domain-containing protein [Oscillospiraceae bacterium]|nr:CAP domain-containing protein [Oscillospiraceae bacterium]
MGFEMGDTNTSFTAAPNVYQNCFYDKNDGGAFHCVLIEDGDARYVAPLYTEETFAAEARLNFHLVNAFRVYHGRSPLAWSPLAAESSYLHSKDMAEKNYFDHTNLDGESPFDRMEKVGISYRCAGENIAAGYGGAVRSHNGWVNSSGHRENMLGADYTHLGVGFCYAENSTYGIYATQNFYKPM